MQCTDINGLDIRDSYSTLEERNVTWGGKKERIGRGNACTYMKVERQGPFFEIYIGFPFVNLRIVFKLVTMVYKCQHGLCSSYLRVQNAAARLITGTGTREHITPALRTLHWLPVKFRITFKLCVHMHQVHIGRTPALSDMIMATAYLPSRRRLRSSNTFRYELPLSKRKFGERSFSYAGPKAWNDQYDLPFAL